MMENIGIIMHSKKTEVMSNSTVREFTCEKLDSLGYLDTVINETFRVTLSTIALNRTFTDDQYSALDKDEQIYHLLFPCT